MNEITVNMENLNDEERKALMALVEKGNKKKWEPSGTCIIMGNGDVNDRVTTWPRLDDYIKNGMCGKTKEQAEYIRDNVFNYAWMIHAWLEVVGDWRPDCDRGQKEGVFYCSRHSMKAVKIWSGMGYPGFYFPSKESCEQWLEMIGDRLDGMLK
jgi:hypothetical protein